MSDGFQLTEIILFAMIAAFLVLRLRSVLGKRTGSERQRPDPFRPPPRDAEGKVVQLPGRKEVEDVVARAEKAEAPKPSTPLEAGLTQISLADPSFSLQSFGNGARIAFEMILGAFASGDLAAVRKMMSDEVLSRFSHEIKSRKDSGQTLEATLVGIREAEVITARMEGRTATVEVRFVSEQINVLRDKEGKTIGGEPNKVSVVTDIWTFARDARSRDPNWILVATQSEA